jgi:hypothetical protein
LYSATFSSSSGSSCGLVKCWSNTWSTLQRPQEHCHMLVSPQTTLQGAVNCASHPFHLHWVSLHCHPYSTEKFLIGVGFITLQASVLKCIPRQYIQLHLCSILEQCPIYHG